MSRETPLAANRPIRVFGFHPQALVLIFVGIAIGIIAPVPKLLVAALALVALGLAHRLSRDPIGALAWLRAFFQKAKYEPSRRKVFRMRIEP